MQQIQKDLTNKTKNKNNKIWIGVFLGLFLLVALLIKGFGLFGSNTTSSSTNHSGADGLVSIPLLEITNEAKWYEYDFSGNKTRFFTIKASDGTIKTAFDACDVCYTEKKGYRQEGDYMVCNNCGNRYPIDGLGAENKTPGGCWPGYLPNALEGDNLVIKKSDLENNQRRSLQ